MSKLIAILIKPYLQALELHRVGSGQLADLPKLNLDRTL